MMHQNIEATRGETVVLFASTGGHLMQMVRFADRYKWSENSLWVTFENAQSRYLLKGRRSLFVDYIAPRDFAAIARAVWRIRKKIEFDEFAAAISTGAGIALAGLPLARMRGTPTHYIESVSRFEGPSLTGRAVRDLRLARTYTQHGGWIGSGWEGVTSVLSDYRPVDRPGTPDPSVFVTLGTIRPYRFDALVDAMLDHDMANSRTVWQTGYTTDRLLPGEQFDFVSGERFRELARSADVVVTHAGVGSILGLLDLGINPVVVPRLSSRYEHVDDHQMQVFNFLQSRNIGFPTQVEDLSQDTLLQAAKSGIQVLHEEVQ